MTVLPPRQLVDGNKTSFYSFLFNFLRFMSATVHQPACVRACRVAGCALYENTAQRTSSLSNRQTSGVTGENYKVM